MSNIGAQLSAGYDILRDDGCSDDLVEEILAAALRAGVNPEHVARKFVQFRHVLKGTR